jgi:hypothetical protein
MNNENYLYRRKRLLRGFDTAFHRVKPFLISWLGENASRNLIQESRQEYETLIPRIPFIGRNNPLTIFFFPTSRYLAMYRAFQKRGFSIDDVGYLVFNVGSEELKAIPGIGRRVIGSIWFSSVLKDRLIKRAEDSQSRKYRGNFVLNYVEGDGQDFDYGVDYIECASCKFLEVEDAFELAPYVCAVDKTASEQLGWGLSRTMTLAEGSHKCDFRFKKGGKTRIILPESLQSRFGSGAN